MAHLQINDIQYLALEGGGGRGVTYLGAIRGLETLGVLPIHIGDRRSQNSIVGISGASAGAITGLLLAMGARSAELEELLSHPMNRVFNTFFDAPSPNYCRMVNHRNEPVRHRFRRRLPTLTTINWDSGISFALLSLARVVIPPIARIPPANSAVYVQNLLFDGGCFPGFSIRSFFTKQIIKYLWRKIGRDHGLRNVRTRSRTHTNRTAAEASDQPPYGNRQYQEFAKKLSFAKFYEYTHVDLIVTGTNVTQQRPALFSKDLTPDFPVAEAVAISMNLPILFKPVYVRAVAERSEVDSTGRTRRISDNSYRGMWVDGGFLNNLPLHAFDQGPSINQNVLGLRLTEPDSNDYLRNDYLRRNDRGEPLYALGYLGKLNDTLRFPSEEGMIRNNQERDQTIDLNTYDLSTYNFAPSPDEMRRPIHDAWDSVMNYFQVTGARSQNPFHC